MRRGPGTSTPPRQVREARTVAGTLTPARARHRSLSLWQVPGQWRERNHVAARAEVEEAPGAAPAYDLASPGVPLRCEACLSESYVQAIDDGVFRAELNELLVRELAEDGYSGVTVRRTTARTDIIIRATRTQKVLGARPRRLRAPPLPGQDA